MAGLDGVLGAGDAVKQLFLWQVLGQVIATAGTPYFDQLTQLVNERHPDVVLSPADLAQLVVRSYRGDASAAAEAARSGIDGERFADLVHLAGEGPAPGDLATALRRGIIGEKGAGPESTSFEQGMREGHLLDKWIPVFRQLATVWPTPTDIISAIVQSQVTPEQGRADYVRTGGDPQWFDLLHHLAGEGPSPLEAAEAARRGIVAWEGTGPGATSFEQAVGESRFRTKWLPVFRALSEYLPPPRTITSMLAEGALDDKQAAKLLTQAGLPPELVSAYLAAAHHQKTAADKALTLSQVIDLYQAGLVAETDARNLITGLNYSLESAGLLLAMADLRRAIQEVNTAVSRVRSLYVGHKIARATAVTSLHTLGVPQHQVDKIISTWDLEASVNVKVLTESQIARAFKAGIMSEHTAAAELTGQGYSPFDAWVILALEAPAMVGQPPAAGPAPPGGAFLPGTTG